MSASPPAEPSSPGARPPGEAAWTAEWEQRWITTGSVRAAAEHLAQAALEHPANADLRAIVASEAAPANALLRAILGVVYRVAIVHAAAARRGEAVPAAVRARGPAEKAAAEARGDAVLMVPMGEPVWSARWRTLVDTLSPPGPLGALGLPGPGANAVRAALLSAHVDDADVDTFLACLLPADAEPTPFAALHEAMLACTPRLDGAVLTVEPAGRGRRASGSFYTPAALVGWLLDAALTPALDEAGPESPTGDPSHRPLDASGAGCASAGTVRDSAPARIAALRLCDPSCGAGAFLVAALRRVALRLDPSGGPAALRLVASQCLYGVDLDPLAVFVCQATLWVATLARDLDDVEVLATAATLAAHIRHGDALLGADAALVAAGVPDLAFTAHPGDDRAVATAWRARNRSERAGRGGDALSPGLFGRTAALAAAPALAGAPDSRRSPISAADAWSAAFFWPRTPGAPPPPTSAGVWAMARVEDGADAGSALGPETAELVARLAATHGFFHWAAAFPEVSGGFDVMLGNPPFLNQLEQDTVATRPAAALLRARFPDEIGAYTDTAALLLLKAARLLRPGGRLAMVQPQSILAAQDARAVRAALARLAPPTHVWWSGAHVFPGASVFVTALALRRGPPVPALVRAHGITFAPLPSGPFDHLALTTAETWAPLVADALGAPPLALRTRGTLADLAAATADFRDEYYGLVPFVVDCVEADERAFPRLVLTGHVDPAWSWWGARPVRFGKRAWIAPRVDLAALERDGGLAAWARARRVPKVLVATQTKVLEAVADPDGAWLTTTPTITVIPHDPARLWHVAAVLLGPPASAWALTHYGASALAAGALKLSARQVEAIPLPAEERAWDEAAAHVAAAHAAADPDATRTHLDAAAAAMVRAYDGDDALLEWWRGRLPAAERRPPR